MANDGEIVLIEIQETQFDEEAVLDSPYEAKDFIKVLPWKTYAEELEEHGSLREKNDARGMDLAEAALDAVEAYGGFPDDFAAHPGWDSTRNKWTIDADAFDEAKEFWEFCGFEVSVSPGVNPQTTL